MKELIEEAIGFIREHEPPEGYALFTSFGKDSVVLHDLCEKSGCKFKAYYNATYIDPPEITSFGRKHYPQVTWLAPDMRFWDGIIKKGLPLQRQRWCCNVLKHKTKSMQQIPFKHHIIGLRKQESPRRAKKPRIETFDGRTVYKPIFEWTEKQIWQYVRETSLPYCSLYDEGWERLGCIVCCMDTSKVMNKKKENVGLTFTRFSTST